jgi:hypothetical protein
MSEQQIKPILLTAENTFGILISTFGLMAFDANYNANGNVMEKSDFLFMIYQKRPG